MSTAASELNQISARLLAVLARERSEGSPDPGTIREKEELAGIFEGWLSRFDPAQADEAQLKCLAETFVTLRTNTAVSAQLARVRLDLANMAAPGRPPEGRPAATYTQSGGRQAPVDSPRMDKTY